MTEGTAVITYGAKIVAGVGIVTTLAIAVTTRSGAPCVPLLTQSVAIFWF